MEKKERGIGIGLTIVQKIAERLSDGRKIWLKSKEGEGTTFTFFLKNFKKNSPTHPAKSDVQNNINDIRLYSPY